MTITNRDMRDQVTQATDASEGTYDVPGIVTALISQYGLVDTNTIDHDAFWSVCLAHTVSADTYRPVYTLGSPDMLIKLDQAMRATGESYPLNLNADDMAALVFALATAVGYVSWDDAGEEVQERAMSLFSGIAETLGIEGV